MEKTSKTKLQIQNSKFKIQIFRFSITNSKFNFNFQIFPPLEPGSDDEFVSKLFWKTFSDFSKSETGTEIRPKIGNLNWPDPFLSTKTGDVIGVDVSRNPRVDYLTKNINFDFWDSIKSADVRKSKL